MFLRVKQILQDDSCLSIVDVHDIRRINFLNNDTAEIIFKGETILDKSSSTPDWILIVCTKEDRNKIVAILESHNLILK